MINNKKSIYRQNTTMERMRNILSVNDFHRNSLSLWREQSNALFYVSLSLRMNTPGLAPIWVTRFIDLLLTDSKRGNCIACNQYSMTAEYGCGFTGSLNKGSICHTLHAPFLLVEYAVEREYSTFFFSVVLCDRVELSLYASRMFFLQHIQSVKFAIK